jgi:hypothetical protein
LMLPGPESDPPGLRPSSGGDYHSGAGTGVHHRPHQCAAAQPGQRRASRKGSGRFSAGSDSTGQHRFLALPPRGTGGAGIAVPGRDCQRPGGDHHASLIVCWQRRETPQTMAGTWPHDALMVTGR